MNDTQTNPNYIPSDDESAETGGRQSFRAVDGKICRGKDESLEVRDKLVGAITKIGVRNTIRKDTGDAERKLVVELAMADGGTESLAVKFYAKKKYGSFSQFFALAFALSKLEVGDAVTLSAFKSNVAHKEHGTFATYINTFKMVRNQDGTPKRDSANKLVWTEIRRPKAENKEGGDPGARVEEELNELKAHPAWGEFASGESDPFADDDENIQLNGLTKHCKSLGWLLPHEDKGAWLELLKKAGLSDGVAFDDVDDGIWGKLFAEAVKLKEQPKILAAAQAALASQSSALSDL